MAGQEFEKMGIDEVIIYLKTDREKGISSEEAKIRLEKYGYNEVTEIKEKTWKRFAKKFWGITPFMLEFTMVFSMVIHSYIDAYVIGALLAVNALIGFTQEERASKAVEMLKKRLQVNARVLRDGKWTVIQARELVPGDIVRVRQGDFVPADLKILEGEVEVDQSALTGESMPVAKKSGDILYSGSIVRRNEANAVVLRTGANTYFGKTAELVQMARPKLHMEKITARIVNYLLIIVIVLISAMFAFTYLRHMNIIPVIPLSLMMIVFAVPVALPAMFTVSMAVGSIEIAKKGVLLTRLSAIEDAASMDTLCADKTGTLTQNRLTLKKVIPAEDFREEDVILFGALASQEANQDPIDMAFITAARERNLKTDEYRIKNFYPFDPSTRRTEAVVEINGREMKIAKGAVSAILEMCSISLTKSMNERMEEFAGMGYRTLAVSVSENGRCKFCGLAALYDPPRPDTKDLISTLREMGISVKMLTGDAEPIAREIAREIGIGERTVKSSELKSMKNTDPVRAANIAEETDCFAEIYPEDKYVIVKSLQAKKHIVGMTGDGVNDAPALKQAEVGIAVSNATDVAKGSAGVVLTSEGLSNIVDLVKEGRVIYQRIVTWVLNKIIKTFEIAVFVALAFLITGRYVLSAMDIVLFLFLIDFVTISISTDRERGSKMPEKWNVSRLVKFSVTLGIFTTAEMFILLYIALTYFHLGGDVQSLNTFFFTSIMFFGIFTPLIVRERGRFYRSAPGTMLVVSIIADVAAVSALSLLGLGLIKPITPVEYVFVLLYSLFASFLVNDSAKILLEKIGCSR